jgi:hypothetical protein
MQVGSLTYNGANVARVIMRLTPDGAIDTSTVLNGALSNPSVFTSVVSVSSNAYNLVAPTC